MNTTLTNLGKTIKLAIAKISPPVDQRRPSTREIVKALKTCRSLLTQKYGTPVKCRYSGCPPIEQTSQRMKCRVLEYLWDFSFSRHDIPQAIEQAGHPKLTNGKYRLLFVAESELGTADEICRDLLKLLEARAAIKCLVYKQPKRTPKNQALQKRMIRVLHNHEEFNANAEAWLFVGLSWKPGLVECNTYTLNKNGTAFCIIE